MSHVHWFCFPAHPPDQNKKGVRDIHKVRDGLAFASLQALLLSLGYPYGGPIFNVATGPDDDYALVQPAEGDTFVLTTRPPLDDEHSERKRVERSGTDLEQRIFTALRRSLPSSWRGGIKLADTHRDRLRNTRWTRFCPDGRTKPLPSRPHRHSSVFQMYKNAMIVTKADGSLDSTLGYMVSVPPDRRFPFRILAAWGMDGYETQLWAHLLRHRLAAQVSEAMSSSETRVIIGEYRSTEMLSQIDSVDLDAVVL